MKKHRARLQSNPLPCEATIFGAKRLRNLGGDLGGAVKGFKNAVKEDGDDETDPVEAGKLETTAERVADEVKDKKEV